MLWGVVSGWCERRVLHDVFNASALDLAPFGEGHGNGFVNGRGASVVHSAVLEHVCAGWADHSRSVALLIQPSPRFRGGMNLDSVDIT